MIVLGLDLSLTGTGMCVVQSNAGDGKGLLATINTTAKTRTEDRLITIRHTIAQASSGVDAAIIEGLSYGSVGGAQAERSALHWMVRVDLYQLGVPYVVVTPMSLKKFVCGTAKAEKSMMIREVYRRWNVVAANDNEADAAALAHLGLVYYGQVEHQTVAQQEVVFKLKKEQAR
jgi:Holliday junction resolvasome RuvABC endonuclease subunit